MTTVSHVETAVKPYVSPDTEDTAMKADTNQSGQSSQSKRGVLKWSKYAYFNLKNSSHQPMGYVEMAYQVAGEPHRYEDEDLLKAARILSNQHKNREMAQLCAENLNNEVKRRVKERDDALRQASKRPN